jgi:hypothetical protein
MTGYSLPSSEFDDFLFAPVGEERNEMLLSVLSALSRLGIDPREEAARLARLPREVAAQSLAAMIGKLPRRRWSPSDSTTIAARLVKLLPSQNDSEASSVTADPGILQMIRSLGVMWMILAVVYGALFMAANREVPATMSHADAPLAGPVSAPQQAPLPGAHK